MRKMPLKLKCVCINGYMHLTSNQFLSDLDKLSMIIHYRRWVTPANSQKKSLGVSPALQKTNTSQQV